MDSQMIKLTMLFLSLLIISSCGGTKSKSDDGLLTKQELVRIDIPFREHGYNNFNSRVIGSIKSYNDFIAEVEQQNDWNNKEDFLSQMKAELIDFEQYNLLLYRLTETSGSNTLTVHAPRYRANNQIGVKIDRVVPDVGNAAMAYYVLAYKFDKNYPEVVFDNGKQKVIIKNIVSNNVVPKNCLTWFDGCNECGRVENNEAVCTEIFCQVNQSFHCKTWEK